MGCYSANDQIEQPYLKCSYLKLKMRSTYLVGFIPLQISDDYADESRYAGEKSNQVQNVNGKDQSVVRNDRRFGNADGLIVIGGGLGHVLTPRLRRKSRRVTVRRAVLKEERRVGGDVRPPKRRQNRRRHVPSKRRRIARLPHRNAGNF